MIGRMLFASAVLLVVVIGHSETGPIRYVFDAGSGQQIQGHGVGGSNGSIVGATWHDRNGQTALCFDGQGDYVDLGDLPAVRGKSNLTILAWLHLDASPYPDEATNWAVVDCEDYRREGFILRIDGATAKLMYRSSQEGADQYGFGATALQNKETFLVGVVCSGDSATLYVDGRPDGTFAVKPPGNGSMSLKISSPGQSFGGCMYEVAIFDRALTGSEVAENFWVNADRFQKDTRARGTIRVRPFIYDDERTARVEADYFGLQPLAAGERALLQLVGPGGAVLQSAVKDVPNSGIVWADFELAGLRDGRYAFRSTVDGSNRNVEASIPFTYPAQSFDVPLPKDFTAGPLPLQRPAPEPIVHMADSGGFDVAFADRVVHVRSSFSFPQGGANTFSSSPAPGDRCEPEWRVETFQRDASAWQVTGSGRYYRVERRIERRPGCILVSDTFTNLAPEPVGIIFRNTMRWNSGVSAAASLGGKNVSKPVTSRELKSCPTTFAGFDNSGAGLIALDDVSIVQARGDFDGSGIALGSDEFALDAGASRTLEWAVYVNETGEYYDFVNAIRRDEGRNNVTVDGALAFVHGTQRKRDLSLVPDADWYAIRNAAYATIYCLSWCTDDPTVSVEGIEFTEYPEERAHIRAMMDAMYRNRPGLKGMFHVAQQLYATNRPNERFADSCVIDAEGNHVVYPYTYENGSYFAPARVADNWRWWIYYPTLDNSFGKAMLDSVDVMMDKLGCRGAFVDGFLWGYGGAYTYDRWDGRSADIDPATKTITRKKGSVLLLTQDAMVAYCRKVWAKGGVVIANGVVPTRTICSLPLIIDREVNEGPEVHLAPTPITLGNPSTITTDEDLYHDVCNKLRAGNLYFFYGDPEHLAYEPMPARMYPITVDEVHSGTIRGKERIVTLHSGVYGWPGSRNLHVGYRYDPRGHQVRPDFVTTADANSVRTQIDLGPDEAAILARIPVQVETVDPVNVVVDAYDGNSMKLRLNGAGTVHIRMPDGSVRHVDLDGAETVAYP